MRSLWMLSRVVRLGALCVLLSLGLVVFGMWLGHALPDTLTISVIGPDICTTTTPLLADTYHVDLDRRLQVRRSHASITYSDATWSPTAETLLVNTAGRGYHYSLITAQNRLLYDLGDFPNSYNIPSWSPDGAYLAYFQQANGENQMLILDTQQLTLSQQVPIPYTIISGHPEWSADGQQLALIVVHPQQPNHHAILIYTLATQDSRLFTLESDAEEALINRDLLVWSPESYTLAFVINMHGINQVWTLDVTRDEWRTLRAIPGLFYNILQWSPDGQSIAISAYDTFRFTMSMIDADGRNERIIYTDTDSNTGFHSLSWSPDGAWMDVRFSQQITSGNIVIEIGSRRHRVVGMDRAFDMPGIPSWSPDGTRHILHFPCGRLLYVEQVDGTQGRLMRYGD